MAIITDAILVTDGAGTARAYAGLPDTAQAL
jgi:hypothetical protein